VRRKSRASGADPDGRRRADPPADPYTLALQWLSVRELSARQVQQRLARRDVPADAAADVVARLRASGVLDDSRVARAAARLETAVRGRGPGRARLKLKALGLADSDVDQALAAAYDEVDVATLLDRALDKRLRRERGDLANPATIRKIVGAMVRQGFAPGAVLARLRKRGTDVDDTD